MLESGRYSTVLELANLAPDIVKLIWENRQPETLTLDNLRKGIPESWDEQRHYWYIVAKVHRFPAAIPNSKEQKLVISEEIGPLQIKKFFYCIRIS